MRRLLIANRGEVAIRIRRAAAELDIDTVAVHAEDDADAPHIRLADRTARLRGTGPAAYLDGAALLDTTRATGCDAIHPGYGFLAESPAFARACQDAGLTWIGPDPDTLDLLGDKTRARAFARDLGIPVLPGTGPITAPTTAGIAAGIAAGIVDLATADEFRAGLPAGSAVLVKAVAGGGGRGMRTVGPDGELAEAIERCRSEARTAFGSDGVFLELCLPRARHIEVQVLGDAHGGVAVLGDRDCSLQRRHQKLVEVAPAPALPDATRSALADAAALLATRAGYRGLGTVEFLLTPDLDWYFLEANPRLQVEHTVTEEVTGLDLVRAQLRVAAGERLADLGLRPDERPRATGFAVQARVNAEQPVADGTTRPGTGILETYEPPGGPGLRVDGHGYPGYRIGARYDPLLAKVIARDPGPDLTAALRRAARALGEFRLAGLATNRDMLRDLLSHKEILGWRVHTTLVDELLPGLAGVRPAGEPGTDEATDDPAVLTAPLTGTVVEVLAPAGKSVPAGATVLVLEAMKMEHPVTARVGGVVSALLVRATEVVTEGQPVAVLVPTETGTGGDQAAGELDLDEPRPDLAALHDRRALTLDAARPDAVARRHAAGRRTARENLAELCDRGSFVEYGGLALAAQRSRRTERELMERTPADGLVAGVGTVNAAEFGPERARVIAMSYDYLVLAGTQGQRGHAKKDRLFELAERAGLPVVLFAEGGGGRPGDTDGSGVTGLDCLAFALYARLSGTVPLVGIASGRCFAGNAALLGCSDVVIATPEVSIGMGGPAMIEGGGLGVFHPDEVGPADVHRANGVIDLLAEDDADAVALARRYLSYFQGPVAGWTAPDQRRLRHAIPENRRRGYDIRAVVSGLADVDSVLELRPDFGRGAVTALIRVAGRPLGLIANNPHHLGGAIDSPAADKIARFLQLCDAFGLPVLSLCDTPGFMVGPEAERTGGVRHMSRMFVNAASLSVPYGMIVLRKGYGLGAQAMAAGSFKVPRFTVSWPTGEFGPMGLEGAVRLGFRNELAAIADPAERRRRFDEMVAAAYQNGKATNVAAAYEIDDVIDPADSRRWITTLLACEPAGEPTRGRRPCVDTW